MSQEKSEKATPKKREDAKRKGQIARGAELPAALGLLGALLAISFLSESFFGTLSVYFQDTARQIGVTKELNSADVAVLFINAIKNLALIAVPVMIVALTAGIAGNFAQGGFTLTAEALKPKGSKFSPAKNIKKIFGLDSLVNLIKSIVKLLLLGTIAYGVLSPVIENAPTLVNAPLGTVAAKLGETLYSLAFRCGLVLIALALADYGYSYYKHEKSLKMSKQDIRDEYKQSEGDPMVKSQRRNAARAITQKRSMAAVPTASVIITNPTHFAIALRYDREKDAAPIVVAKGADKMAFKIREIAKEHDIPLVENKPLARALYKAVEPNQIIPAEFYAAIAEILAFVFRQKRI